jgi:DNA-binding transcriptional ArsR family regulator
MIRVRTGSVGVFRLSGSGGMLLPFDVWRGGAAVLRVHFTADDLARTYLLPAADPLWEVMLSHFLLHERVKPLFFQPWLRWLTGDPKRMRRARPGARVLAGLAPQGPYFPDFLTPAESRGGLDTGLEAIAATSRRRLLREVNLLAECGRDRGSLLPDWLGLFAVGDRAAMGHLSQVLRQYHGTAIAPYRDVARGSVDLDVAYRTRALIEGGVEGLFRSFAPLMTWNSPVLEIRYDVDQTLRLEGRGLRLVPSFFCHGSPVSMADPELVPVVIYPVAEQFRWPVLSTANGKNALAKLVGTTRAAVLDAIDDGATTSGLARLLTTSSASISRHTAVLREAGLITTHRRGPAVEHVLTTLGRQLLTPRCDYPDLRHYG